MYNCKKKVLHPPKNFIKYNSSDKYKDSIRVDACIADEIEELWNIGIRTMGCCCGHGRELGFIEVADEDIELMEGLGYCHYIYPDEFGGEERKDAFVPMDYGHVYGGYTKSYKG